MSADAASQFDLDPEVVFLNHGSFGACPTPVREEQARLRARLEREPVRFFVRELPGLADAARETLAAFVGADADELVFVPNATTGVNSVLRSLPLGPGDELLTTDHEYGACRNALDFVAARRGCRVVVARVPFPIDSLERVVEAVLEHVGARTRLALLDHVTSSTGLVFPIERLVEDLAGRGVDTLVDGAHAPGMLALDLRGMAPAYYTGNAHKWLCAPRGAAFLFVRKDKQAEVRPLAISHGAAMTPGQKSRFVLEFEWTGTHDPTPYLCIPSAIGFLGSLLPGGFPELMARNRALALEARTILGSALSIPAPCPDAMIGSLAAVPLPDGPPDTRLGYGEADPLQDLLMRERRIEVPVIPWPQPPKRIVRISAQIYNHKAQYELLADALVALLR